MQKLTKPIRSNIGNTHKRLSIQVNLSGLSFCVYNPDLQAIEHFYELKLDATQPTFHQAVKEFVSQKNELQQEFEQVKIIHNNDFFSLVPKELFSSNSPKEYLRFSVADFQENPVSYDEIPSVQAINVYVPNTELNICFRDIYREIQYEHFASLLLKTIHLFESSSENEAFLHFEENRFYMAVYKNQNLTFFNCFSFQTPTDVLYYLLFSLEQLGLNLSEISLFLFGEISYEQEVFKLIYSYIESVGFLSPHLSAPFWLNSNSTLAKKNFVITHSFQ